MLDLRVLRDLWAEGGARDVFEMLVAQCVRATYPLARTIRCDPGDDGIDTFFGDLKGGSLRVWQAKYFPGGIESSQQSEIRSSFATCRKKNPSLSLWTLCIPIPLSTTEQKWWEGWRSRESKKSKCAIELWEKSTFVAYQTKPALAPVFDMVLRRNGSSVQTVEALGLALGPTTALSVVSPEPSRVDAMQSAVFVRKLEAAGYREHRAARTAFYNFELLRSYVQEGGDEDTRSLEDLSERVLALWEDEFNRREVQELGKQFVVALNDKIDDESDRRLQSTLPAQSVHKRGCLYHWADVCQAGWASDYRTSAVTAPTVPSVPSGS